MTEIDKSRLEPTVYGIGYLGIGEYKARDGGKEKTKEYIKWISMLSRCYGKAYRSNPMNPKRYEDCTVCEEWHNFQNFAKWCNEQPNFGRPRYALDKDMIEFGNTVYSPDKCWIISPAVNSIIKMVSWKKDSDLPTGVYRSDGCYSSVIGGKSKYSQDVEELSRWCCGIKKEKILKIAQDYQQEIPEVMYFNLINYDPSVPVFN